MSLWSRITNVFRSDRLSREIDEELQSHLEEAEAQGRDISDARKAFGSPLRTREEARDVRLISWLDSLRADAVFGFRRLRKTKVTSAAAIFSLALAIGACTSAFRLIDALLLRPLPVAHPERLYSLSRHGTAMKIPLLDGRDFRADDLDPSTAIVNETFVKTYLNGENPIGKTFYRTYPRRIPSTIVGLARDSRYSDMREASKPVAYLPFYRNDSKGVAQAIAASTIVVRTAGANPLALASTLRREVPRARSEFRVRNLHTQQELIDAQTIRERLLAMLALFFAAVALLLAAVGLYGVLDYSVVQRRREIGIRLAIGAPSTNIMRLVTMDVLAMVLAGAIAGLALRLASVRYIETLFYQVKAADVRMLALPALAILAAALLASVPAMIHAVRIDPVNTLRSE